MARLNIGIFAQENHATKVLTHDFERKTSRIHFIGTFL